MKNLNCEELQNEYILEMLKYQYGQECAEAFTKIFENRAKIKIQFSKKTNKIKQILYDDKPILFYKSSVGRFSLTIYGAYLLHTLLEFPKLRAVVLNSVSNFIKEGKSVFSHHVIQIDSNLRINDDVLIVNENDEILGVGKLTLPSQNHIGFNCGMMIENKKGIKKLGN